MCVYQQSTTHSIVDITLIVNALSTASGNLDTAANLAPSSVDLAGRLGTRIEMLRDEIGVKRNMLGLSS